MLYQEYNRRKNKMAEGAVIKKKIKRLLIPFGKEQPLFIQNLFLCVYKYNAMQAACRAGFGASATARTFFVIDAREIVRNGDRTVGAGPLTFFTTDTSVFASLSGICALVLVVAHDRSACVFRNK